MSEAQAWRVIAERRGDDDEWHTEELGQVLDTGDWRDLYDAATKLAEADCCDVLEVVNGTKWGSADHGCPEVYAHARNLRNFNYILTPVDEDAVIAAIDARVFGS